MRRWVPLGLIPLLAVLLSSWVVVCPVSASDGVLVEGDPPLTDGMVARARGFYEWLLDARMNEEQRGDFQQSLVDSWESGDAGQIANILDVLNNADGVGGYSESEKALLRETIQPNVLDQLRSQAGEGDMGSAWLLALYDRSHQPIADGNPPLTRQVSDATAEALTFMIAKAFDQEYKVPGADVKDSFGVALVEGYSGYTPEEQEAMAGMPMYWAALGVYWPDAPEEKRAQLRQQWREQLSPLVQEDDASSGGQAASGQQPSSDSDPKPMGWVTFNTLQLAQHQTFLSSVNLIRGNYTAAYTYGLTPR
ncbi:MAG TPA: hypothetical protein VHS06_04120 [Chloroflexota bacterium]|nr:hypothetical protein [Chloroflexota bacterium]